MRILLLTNHLINFGGSELQILELYRFFKQHQCKVNIFASGYGHPIINFFDVSDILQDPSEIILEKYNIIWNQHFVLPRLFKNKNQKCNAIIFSVHLSPYEPLEFCSVPCMLALDNIHFIANSYETRDKLLSLGVNKPIHISFNAAPNDYLTDDIPKELRKIAIVSNHYKGELREAAEILAKDYQVDIYGRNGGKIEIVTPELIKKYDCIISIGKTVQYSILANRPIYVYDHFGGSGYLNKENYDKAIYYNFSGRGFERKDAKTIVKEIKNGFNDNIHFIKSRDKSRFILDHLLAKLLTLPKKELTRKDRDILHQFYPIAEILFKSYL